MEACGRGSEGPLWFAITPAIPEHSSRCRSTGVGRLRNNRGRDDAMLLATLARGAIAYRSGHFAAVATSDAELLVRHFDRRSKRWKHLAWHTRRRPPPCARRARQPVHRAPAGSQNQLPAAGECWRGVDRDRPWRGRWNGTEITSSGIPTALQQTTALNMIRDRASNIWIAAEPGDSCALAATGPCKQRRRSVGASQQSSRIAMGTSRSVRIEVSNGGAILCLPRIRLRKACLRTPRAPSMLTSPGGSGSGHPAEDRSKSVTAS